VVEHAAENRGVASSTLASGTTFSYLIAALRGPLFLFNQPVDSNFDSNAIR
jgi:hypothetical protein